MIVFLYIIFDIDLGIDDVVVIVVVLFVFQFDL